MNALGMIVFGLSVSELAVIGIGIGYAWSLIRDWRPMGSLRKENHDLRDDLDRANKRIEELERQVEKLKTATDLTALQKDHTRIAEVLDHVADTLAQLDGSVKANTAAVQALGSRVVVDEASRALLETAAEKKVHEKG